MLSSPELLPLMGRCDVIHAEHVDDCKLQQHMLPALLARRPVDQSLQGALTGQQITQVCYGSRQHLITVIQVDFGEQYACILYITIIIIVVITTIIIIIIIIIIHSYWHKM